MKKLTSLQTLAPALSLDVIEASILPMMDKLVNDDIPNIRFNVAKSYGVLIDTLKQLPEQGTVLSLQKEGKPAVGCDKAHQLIKNSILPNLEKLMQDEDTDVRYFASTAGQGYKGVGNGSGDGDAEMRE